MKIYGGLIFVVFVSGFFYEFIVVNENKYRVIFFIEIDKRGIFINK